MRKKSYPACLLLTAILSLSVFFIAFHNRASADKKPEENDLIYLIRVEGEIDLGLAPFIKRVVDEADDKRIPALVLEINTFGGRLDAAVQIRDTLLNARTLTVAFINERAISAGALISLACQRIFMAPGATIGAATPITVDRFSQKVSPASEKVISYFRKEMKATAEKNDRPTILAEAMVDPDVVIEGLSEKGKLLTLTTAEAIQNKLADSEVSGGIEGVLAAIHLSKGDILTQKPNWAERFLRVISGSLLSSLLLAIGMLGLFLEFRTPTWGIAGTAGIICLILFFWGHWVLQLVGWEEILLLAIGLSLLILEAFIPGFGIPGILGILVLAFAFTLSLVGRHPSAAEIWTAVSHISIVFFFVLIVFIISVKSLAKTRTAQRFILHTRTESAHEFEGNASLTEAVSLDHTRENLKGEGKSRLGLEGIAYTNLRPAGKGIFGEERLNVVTEGDFIDKDTPIRICRIEGSKIIVQKIKEKKKE